jgi:quercetin dioxygenase-like cupin family protein
MAYGSFDVRQVRPLAAAILLAFAASVSGASAESATTLLDTGETILGQKLTYPTGAPAKVTAVIVTLQPGEETGWHEHDVPMFAYILDGELTVDYGPRGKRVYRKGDAAMEAIDTAHNGHNSGAGVARVLAVFAGAGNVPDTVKVAPPAKETGQSAEAR